ncbi:MAG: thiol-disulfide oxidoreductase DCC family protein [Planctomycetota bacterium]
MSEVRGWILYDGRCPICRRGARRMGGVMIRRGYRLTPLQRRWVREMLARTSMPVGDELLVLLPDKRLLGGVDAFIHLAMRVWWAWPFAALASLPGLNFLARKFYAWFAANRLGISRACGIESCRVGE